MIALRPSTLIPHMLTLACVCSGPALLAQDKLVVIPDTQVHAVYPVWSQSIADMTSWIRQNAAAEDISFVTHVGDVVSGEFGGIEQLPTATWPEQWQRAHQAMLQLDFANTIDGQVLPYSVSLGNHDLLPRANKLNDEDTLPGGAFRTYFGADRYAGYSWYGASDATEWNHYQLFEANGNTYLHINLEYRPELVTDDLGLNRTAFVNDGIAWAQSIIDAHPGVPTLLSTHQLLTDLDTPANSLVGYVGDGADTLFGQGENTSTGDYIWEHLIRSNPQIFMTFNGHDHEGPYREDGEYFTVNTNDAGLPVYQALVNYQDYFNPLTGNDPYLRLITFDEVTGEIRHETFSPTFERFQQDPDAVLQYLDGLLQLFELGLPIPLFAGEDLAAVLGTSSFFPGDPVDSRAEAEAAILLFFGATSRDALAQVDFSPYLTDPDSQFAIPVRFLEGGRAVVIPEPAALAGFALVALLGLCLYRQRRRSSGR